MKKIKVKRVGEHRIEGNLYKDSKGRYYVDGNRDAQNPTELYILVPHDDPDGEPYKLVKNIEVSNPFTDKEMREKSFQFEYMLLSRLQSDCIGYLSDGDCRFHNVQNIWGSTTERHIAKMKELWQKIPEDLKPEWCTWEQILDYEKQMCA